MKQFYSFLLIFTFGLLATAQTPTGSSTEVGITEGQLSVSLSGGANYTVPIAAPPGINGVVPQVSLVYNSQSFNGVAGYGWNIAGISTISSIASTKYHDGTVSLGALNRFAFDGQRLILKSGSYGVAGSVYETENFSTVKITLSSAIIGTPNHPDLYFMVEYPDGSKAYYGKSVDSRSVSDWAITYWENAQGVRISYTYLAANNTLNIDSISYGSVQAAAPINQIKFVYVNRTRPEQGYTFGQSVIRNKILSTIQVIGNGIGFRNYALAYNETTLGYQRLISITEKNGDLSKSYNPTTFQYTDTQLEISPNSTTASLAVGNISSANSSSISGDFDGDGKMDFVLYPTNGTDAKKKFWMFTDIKSSAFNSPAQVLSGSFEEIFPTTFLFTNNKIADTQGVLAVQSSTTTKAVNFNTYYNASYGVPVIYSKQITFPVRNISECNQSVASLKDKSQSKKYISGDFNGDGLTDIIAIDNEQMDVSGYCIKPTVQYLSTGKVYFIDMDTRKTTSFWNDAGTLTDYFRNYEIFSVKDRIETLDVNGDGKTDILHFKAGSVTVYSLNDNNQLVQLWKTTDTDILTTYSILPGDYNGDGKMDFMIPKNIGLYNSSDYVKFISTGSGFVKTTQAYEFQNLGSSEDNDAVYINNLIPLDFNGDGKTDIIQYRSVYNKNTAQGRMIIRSYSNSSSGFSYSHEYDTQLKPETLSTIKAYPLPIFLSPNQNNQYLEIAAITNNLIYTFSSKKDFSKEVLVNSITTGNGVKESITYNPLQQDEYEPFYSPTRFVETYPNADIVVAPNFKIVTKLEKKSATTYKKQLFFYSGAVSNAEGLGFFGFRSTTKTNWHDDNNAMISTVTRNDISLRGANVENYTVLGYHSPLAPPSGTLTPQTIIKEGAYTVTGTENLIATQSIILKPNTLIQSGSVFLATINEEANASPDTPTTFITKSKLIYQNEISTAKVFKLKNIATRQFNGLDGTSSETYVDYDEYNNPVKSTTLLKEGSTTAQTTVSEIAYNAPTTGPYVLGRPASKKQTISVSGDAVSSEELYTYTNGLLTQLKKKGNNTDYVIEDNEYDAFGNIKKKKIIAAGLTPRETSYEYDSSGRFMIKSIDIETLATTFTYYPDSTLKSETNPYLQTTTYLYDSWFKKIKTTDYLGKSSNFAYTRSAEKTNIITTGDDGSRTEEYFDDLGRKIKDGTKNVMGTISYKDYLYDIYDRNYKVSEPYFGSSASQWTETKYDDYGRPVKNTSFTGKTTNITYSGLTTTVSEATKTKTSVKNAIGNVVSITDTPGGQIQYTYFADGSVKESSYANVKTTVTQDGWGRKIKLVDASAGTYTYQYNSFGETLSETGPNGTTAYKIDIFGKITEKTVVGTDINNTNSITTYEYTGTLLKKSTFKDLTNGLNQTTNEFFYDANKRISYQIETTPYATFRKDFTYDAFGRIDIQTLTASTSGKSSSKSIKNTYLNGAPWQILDGTNNTIILWQTNTVNARGQLLTAQNGPTALTKTYDSYGYVSQYKYDKTTTPTANILTLNTVFDAAKGNLTTRTNSIFSRNESFKYDSQDRLTEYTNILGIQETQSYDDQGRITQNSLGSYKYSKADKPYQNSSVELTPEARGYYGGRQGIFNDSMEDKTGWETEKYPATAFNTYDTTKSQTGKTSLKLANTLTTEQYVYADKWISIDNAVATQYTYTAWVYSDSPQAQIFLFMKDGANAITTDNVVNNTTGTWTPITKTFLVPASIKKLRLRLDNNGLGNIWYDNVQIRKTSDPVSTDRILNTTYNAFKSPVQIEETGVDKISFVYNDGNARSAMFYGSLEDDKLLRPYRKYYSADGTMEIKENRVTGTFDFVTYIGGDGYSAPVVVKGDGIATQNYLYLQRDYQGTIMAITDQQGTVVEKRLFDAWGNIVKVQDAAGNILEGLTVLDRGYTGHEHLQSIGIINMNGRLYDPKLHRFLQPDNYVQDPSNTQSFNRYAYCWNNPLKYADYNGEWFGLDDLIVAAASFVIGYVSSGLTTGNWGWTSVRSGLISAVTGWVAYNTLGASTFSDSCVAGNTGMWNFIASSAVSAGVSYFMQPMGIQVGNWSFSISPAIAFGNTMGIGANLSITYSSGDFSFSGGIGIMSNSNYNGFGKNGLEIRESILAAYDDGKNGFSLGTNFWQGDFNQRTGLIGLHSGDFRTMYENDGGIGIRHLGLGDKNDSYRSAALNSSIGDFNFGFNLFTGERSRKDQESEDASIGINYKDRYGVNHKNAPVNEVGTRYRLGALTIGYGNAKVGVDSEHVRHAIQNSVIHRFIDDNEFLSTSWDWKGYSQTKATNIFTSW